VLHPSGWSGATVERSPDTNAVFSMNFEVDGATLPVFDLAVPYVEFYR
jgi:hypothetical protein